MASSIEEIERRYGRAIPRYAASKGRGTEFADYCEAIEPFGLS
jgi:hypothetical protein